MLFFAAILALVVVSVLTVRAVALRELDPATPPRGPRVKARAHAPAALLDGPSLRGLY